MLDGVRRVGRDGGIQFLSMIWAERDAAETGMLSAVCWWCFVEVVKDEVVKGLMGLKLEVFLWVKGELVRGTWWSGCDGSQDGVLDERLRRRVFIEFRG